MVKILFSLLLAVSVCLAGDLDEAVVQSDDIYSARALGFAGAYTAIANDFSAVLWNPACLTRIRSKELHLSAGYRSLRNEASNLKGMSGTGDVSEIKVGALGFVYPFPVKRGSLVLAMGYTRSKNYLDVLSLSSAARMNNSRSDGYLSDYNLAMGFDLSENISFGGTMAVHSGFEDYVLDTVGAQYSMKDDYFGIGLTTGFLIKMPMHLLAGLNVKFYDYVSRDRSSAWTVADTLFTFPNDTKIIDMPMQVSFGLAYATVPFTVSLDGGYTNWTNLKYRYKDEAPVLYGTELRDTYRGAAGIEWLVPALPVKVRAGAGYENTPFTEEEVVSPLYYSAGVGLLLDNVLAIDIGGLLNNPEIQHSAFGKASLNEQKLLRKLQISLSYRY